MAHKLWIASIVLLGGLGLASVSTADISGKPFGRPLPDYCQHGYCETYTIESVDLEAAAPAGALFKASGQIWEFASGEKRKRRSSNFTYFILCSKQFPAVIDSSGATDGVTVDFLTPEHGESYGHANQLLYAAYFAVCHARVFEAPTNTDADMFAKSLGYRTTERESIRIKQSREIFSALKMDSVPAAQASSACKVPPLKQGMTYRTARDAAIRAGFQAPPLTGHGFSASDQKVIAECNGDVALCNRLPEIESCGSGHCAMSLADAYGNALRIVTYGEIGDGSARVTSFQIECKK